jgi:hypothetical protein
MLTLTPMVLGTCCCMLLLQMLCRMKKLVGGVKRVFSSSLSNRGLGSRTGDGSQDSEWSSFFVPSPHETKGSICYLAHDSIPMAREGWNGRRASPHPLDCWLGKTLRRGSDDLSARWMTLQPCKGNVSIHQLTDQHDA